LTRTHGYDAGVVISASHNPFEDNGIKVFSGKGEKFTERVEREVEAIVADTSWHVKEGEPAHVPHADLVGAYLDHLRAVVPEAQKLKGFKLAIDCANGATTTVAPPLFSSLGLNIDVVGDQPDGRNINLGCGSTHPQMLARIVVERGCQMVPPSTATAIARSSSTTEVRWWTATPCADVRRPAAAEGA
jgi:phosphoglucosamine mutase